jgi:hypothetical protein
VEFQLDFGITVSLMAIAIPFLFFREFPSQEVPEQLGYCWQNVFFSLLISSIPFLNLV